MIIEVAYASGSVSRAYEFQSRVATRKFGLSQRHCVMATGTGKTFTIVNEIHRLMKSGVAPRVLFLVDRRALAAQTVRAFSSFEAAPGLKFDKIYEVYSQRFQSEDFGEEDKFDPKLLPHSYLENPKPGTAFVYVSTIQRTAINLFGRSAEWGGGVEGDDEDAEQLARLPIHAFDLIVADECHRGYTASQTAIWRKTLDHFDAIKIGLTATPALHTTTLFREKVFEYKYETAVAKGYLVDYDVVKIKSNVRMNGIFLKEGEEVTWERICRWIRRTLNRSRSLPDTAAGDGPPRFLTANCRNSSRRSTEKSPHNRYRSKTMGLLPHLAP